MSYPEHEKLQEVKEKSQFIGGFIDHMSSKGFTFYQYVDDEEYGGDGKVLVRCMMSIEQMLADYLDIDLVKLEEEKIKMIQSCRDQKAI